MYMSKFWFFNKKINPLVIAVLRSPFHRLLSKRLILIRHTGIVTGKKHALPVQYAIYDQQEIVVVPGRHGIKKWCVTFVASQRK